MIKLTNLLESINMYGVMVSVVPINWADPNIGKFSGQLKIQYGDQVSFYKMTVDTMFYKGNVLLNKLWKKDDGSFGIATSKKGQVFDVDATTMANIVKNVKSQSKTFTVSQSGVDLTLDKKV